MALIRYEQHVPESVISLAPPWWGKPRIAALLKSYVDRLQAVEDDLWEIIAIRELETADLPRLKILGLLIGQPRLLFSEEMYRKVLQARAIANISRGRASDILAVLEILIGSIGSGSYSLVEGGDASLYISALIPVDAESLAASVHILPDVRAVGVGVQFLFTDDPDIALWGSALWGDDDWASVRVL